MSDVTCRGSFALGTACGKCSRCRREIESYNAMKAVRDKLNTPSSSLSRIEELEAVIDRQHKRSETLAEGWRIADDARIELEAKLAKAVAFLEFLDGNYRHVWGDTARAKIRELYAELKGQDDEW